MTKTLLIIVGLACAVITAAGMMFNPISSAFRQMHSKDPDVRCEAITYLSRIDKHILSITYKSSKPLQAFYDKGALIAIRRALADEESVVRATAIYGLISLGDDESIPAIRKMLAGTDDWVRDVAAYALAEFNDKTSIPEIRKLLYVKDYSMIIQAMETLYKLGDKESIPAIRKLCATSSKWVRHSAIYILSHEWKDKESIPQIKELLKDPEKEVRAAAEKALRYLEALELIPGIIKLLHHPDVEVSLTALKDLTHLEADEAIPDIKKLLKDEREIIRHGAEEALRKFGMPEEEIERAKSK